MAQLASASGLGPEGPVFESQYPDKTAVRDYSPTAVFIFYAITGIMGHLDKK